MPDARKPNGNGTVAPPRASAPAGNFLHSRKRIDELPEGGQILDTLAGSLLRIFARIERMEGALQRLSRRLTAVEDQHRGAGDLLTPITSPPGRAEPR